MGNIIEFIFGNFFFVLIIIYVISSLFRKNRVVENVEKRKQELERSPETTSETSTIGGNPFGDLFKELEKELGDVMDFPKPKPEKPIENPRLEPTLEPVFVEPSVIVANRNKENEGLQNKMISMDQYRNNRESRSLASRPATPTLTTRSNRETEGTSHGTGSSPISTISPRDGMKWALIYGPPRAKSPYRFR